jgi:murein DD-endopeptidase MepM/ murein hydrolase activator NlpD
MFKRPQAYLAAALPLAVPLVLAAISGAEPAAAPATRLDAAALSLRYTDLALPNSDTLPEHSMMLTVEEDDTLDAVLSAGGLNRAEASMLTREFGKSIDLRRLRPGHLLRFHHDATGAVDSVQMKVTAWGEIEAVRTPDGFDVTTHPAEQRVISSVVAAEIDTSLYDALRGAGEGPQLVQQLVDVFQWDIDFFSLQKGDSFSIVVDKKFAGSDPVGYGPIAAARFTSKGQTVEAYRQEMPDGRAGYYARNGMPLRKQFLRAPLQFTHITSGFSKSRFHPILHAFRPHHGVDYGAPAGTPVMTTADGVVVSAGYSGGEGNCVRIRHNNRMETYYLHLSRFAKGLKPGKQVIQGDVIGYVGMTGLATGPHLDYRVTDGGSWINPLKLKSISPDPLHGESLRMFRASVVALSPKLTTPAHELAEYAAKRRALF